MAYVKETSIEKILRGQAVGNELYGMRRCRDALLKKDAHCSELILLKALIERVTVSQQLMPDKVLSHTAPERKRLLEAVGASEVSWPEETQALLVGVVAKEQLVEHPMNVPDLIAIVSPYDLSQPGDEEGQFRSDSFDPFQPKLASCTFAEHERAKCFLKVCVQEVLVPLVARGEPAIPDVVAVTAQLLELQGQMQAHLTQRGPVLSAALQDVGDCCRALVTILGSQELYVKELNAITEAKLGAKHVLRQAILQTPYYRQQLQVFRQCEVAESTMSPKLQACLASLQKEVEQKKGTVSSLSAALSDLPLWRKSLRAGSTKKLEGALAEHAEHLLASVSDIEGLEALCRLFSSHLPTVLDIEEPS